MINGGEPYDPATWRPTTAQMFNPPDDPEFQRRMDTWLARKQAEIEALPPAPQLVEVEATEMPQVAEEEQRRLARMMVDGLSVSAELADCVATFREWLHLPDPGALYVTCATVAANRAEGDPVWLLLVSPPGGGKTEMLNPLSRLHDVRAAATLTEAAPLSGVPKRERASNSKGGLLNEIGDFGILVHKDFGSVLSMHRDARAQVLAALREVYDGSWTRHVGTDGGRTLSWSGKVGLIAGCTPSIDSHHAVVGAMGERFVMYRLPKTNAEAQARRALSHVGKERTMREALGEAVASVLVAVDEDMLLATVDQDVTERLVSLSTLAVRCRSAVERDGYTRDITLIPEPEAPARLALVLLRLLNGLRAIGVSEAEAWRLVAKCALDSMPAIRRAVVEYLMSQGGGRTTTTSELGDRLGYPTVTARRALEDLAAHGIARKQAGGAGRADVWQPTEWARERWVTVSEMSGEMRTEQGISAQEDVSISPLTIEEDISGTPTGADLWDGWEAEATA